MVILAVSIVNYYVGTFIPPTEEKQAKGFTGYNSTDMPKNQPD